MIERHAYLLLWSWLRMVSMAYYPTVTMIMWAFVTVYLRPTSNFLPLTCAAFIGAVLLWTFFSRGQLGLADVFRGDVSRNLGNLFVSPLRAWEMITVGQQVMSIIRTVIGVGAACVFAWLLFNPSPFSANFP